MSSEMEKGRKWSPEISDRLGETRFGLLCLTRENLNAPWLLFEAGALSKTRDAYVWTFLHGLSPADVEQPLAQFQHTISEKADVRKLLHTINQVVRDENEKGLTESTLDKVFETFWPELENGLRSLADQQPQRTPELRSDRDLLEEILQLVRSEQRPNDPVPTVAVGSGRFWGGLAPEPLRRVSRIAIILDASESTARALVDYLRKRLSMAEFDLSLAPGTDRVSNVMVRFTPPASISDEVIQRLLTTAGEVAGVKTLNWNVEPVLEL